MAKDVWVFANGERVIHRGSLAECADAWSAATGPDLWHGSVRYESGSLTYDQQADKLLGLADFMENTAQGSRWVTLLMLDQYLLLERLVAALENGNAFGLADDVRDAMDSIHHRLTPDEVAQLDARGMMGLDFHAGDHPTPRQLRDAANTAWPDDEG